MCILSSVSFCCALVWQVQVRFDPSVPYHSDFLHEHTVFGNMSWEKVIVDSISEGQSDFAWNRFSSKGGKEMIKEAKLASWKATWPKLQLDSLQPTPPSPTHHTKMAWECVLFDTTHRLEWKTRFTDDKTSYTNTDYADRSGIVHWGWWCSPGDSAAIAPRSEGTQVTALKNS